ncbi:MAG: M13 family metallopeptidase [Cyanobacteria bacterium TGS_CYA1]|nr:M13 family metallopeptidase [Cyanobacteria bacterium TGS_CYA1]
MINKRSLVFAALASTILLTPMANVSAQDNKTGISVTNMDKSVPPGKDFFLYANGTWLKNTPVPNEYDKWGVLNILADQNLTIIKTIAEDASKKLDAKRGTNEQKIGDFYAAGMDEAAIESAGLAPLHDEIHRIEGINTKEELRSEIARLHRQGVNVFFAIGSGQDFKDSTKVICQVQQGGLGLPDRDYYTNDDEASKKLRAQYVEHMAKMFHLMGQPDGQARAKAVMDLETKLAEYSMKNTDMRDPDKIYHKMNFEDLQKMTPNFEWSAYLKEIKHDDFQSVNVGQPTFFEGMDEQIEATKPAVWKDYLLWHLISESSPYLSTKFVDEHFNFYGKILTGKKANLPRWKRVLNSADSALGEALGQLYVKDHFTPKAKEKALHLVSALRDVLKEDLSSLSWMDDATRKNALEKLDSFGLKIGYPDKWRDYDKLEISRESYLKNMNNASEFEFDRQMAKIGKPVDRNEWFMSPQTVNAYYMAEMNEIVFPAGILQSPIFDPDADDATNLGAMGMVIGHEMTHGFDDQGSKFDGKGNLKNWWSENDLKRFQERVSLIENQYQGYKAVDDVAFKGKLVAGEAAADLGGLTLAYKALQKLQGDKPKEKDQNGFTPEQRFFLSFAQAWATNVRPEKARLMAAVDPHPTPHYRVLGTLANMDEFQKAYDISANESFMPPENKRCRLW